MDDSVWRLTPLRDYRAPQPPAGEAVRSGARELLARLQERVGLRLPRWLLPRLTDEEPQEDQGIESFHRLPSAVLSRLAPEQPWRETGHSALEQWLGPWLEADSAEAGAKLLIVPPHGPARAMATGWLAAQGDEESVASSMVTLASPTPSAILGGDNAWLSRWQDETGAHLVLPHLEHCFLRHQDGLTLLRRFLDWFWAEQPACLLICDSWAWRYFAQVLDLHTLFPSTAVLAPLEGPALVQWLTALAREQAAPVIFRNRDNGQEILEVQPNPPDDAQPAENGQQNDKESGAVGDFFAQLAARSRGNPQVAWSIWRHSLGSAEPPEEQDLLEEADNDQGLTVWVQPWDRLELPMVPGDADTAMNFVLHALLLHNGLPQGLLPSLLPLPPAAISQALQRLHNAKLIEQSPSSPSQSLYWRVGVLAYPAVRSYLAREGFLVDDL